MGAMFSTKRTPHEEHASRKRAKELREEFDALFLDMEFRCKSAALMNNHEASRYEKWADRLQMSASIVGAAAVSGIGVSVAKTKRVTASKAGVAGILAIPLCAVLQFLSNGSSQLAPTLSEKAKLHVQASAGWKRIARLTTAYRLQLRHLPLEAGTTIDTQMALVSTWYRELVVACEEVSSIVPIRDGTYDIYNQAEVVHQVTRNKVFKLQRYQELEAGSAPPDTSSVEDFKKHISSDTFQGEK